MSTAEKKVIVVFGATGNAGGSVAKYLLEDGTFAVRAVTRNANSPKAQELKSQGATIVEADLGNAETVAEAVKGAYGVAGITDFWTILPTVGFSAEAAQHAEEAQGRTLVDAVKAAGVKHFVWFNLWHSDTPHSESKHVVAEYLRGTDVPTTMFINSFYFENLLNPAFGMLQPQTDFAGTVKSYKLNIVIPPDVYMPSYSVDQTGGWVLEAFRHPGRYIGKEIIVAGEHVTTRRYAEVLARSLGKPVEVLELSYEAFHENAKSENVYVKEMYLNMKLFLETCQPPNSPYDEAASKAVYPGQHDLESFVRENPRWKSYVASLRSA
ncbi:NAD(P)-binding protein [Auriculariales sp. MPI-PUGE-AT-0066]|nr:NAD(P)-binding protein [Auriculariales sp. MPI-PUGE-AT-0066]